MKCAKVLTSFLVLLCSSTILAEEPEFGGHAKYQYSYLDPQKENILTNSGADPLQLHALNLRGTSSVKWDKFKFETHAEFLGLGSSDIQTLDTLRQEAYGRAILPADDSALFDLSRELSNDSEFISGIRLDRLYLSRNFDSFSLKAGRDAVSWGNGLTFQALDFLNPFSPTEIDRDYKSGVDLFSAQTQISSTTDLELLAVPRRDVEHNVADDASSFAARLRTVLNPIETNLELVTAKHFDENLFGVSLSHNIFDAVFRFDLSLTNTEDSGDVPLIVTNIDRSWVVFEKNVYGYIEYLYSGFGESRENYYSPSDALSERIARGELYTLGRNYLSLGGRLELHPLWNLFSNLIFNLDDESGIIQLHSQHDLLQDLQLLVGFNLPYGGSGDEYGGVPTQVPGISVGPSSEGYVRLQYYF